jgi:hypothetical protein
MVPATDTRVEHLDRIERRRPAPLALIAEDDGKAPTDGEPAGAMLDWSNPTEVRCLVRLLTGDLEELMCSLLEPPDPEVLPS